MHINRLFLKWKNKTLSGIDNSRSPPNVGGQMTFTERHSDADPPIDDPRDSASIYMSLSMKEGCQAGNTTFSQKIQQVVNRLQSKNLFNGHISVFKDGHCVLGQDVVSPGGEPVTNQTLFRIGSLTKFFTSILVMDLVSRDKLRLDSKVQDLFTGNFPIPFKEITIAQLLSHTSGLPTDFPKGIEPTDQDLLEKISTLAMRPPGDDIYSNLGYLILGKVVEKLYGQPYDAAVREHIFEPLGMKDSFVDLRDSNEIQASRLEENRNVNGPALNYRINMMQEGGEIVSNPIHVNAKIVGAAGSIVSSPRDLQKFFCALAATLKGNQSRLPVKKEILESMTSDHDSQIPGLGNWRRGLGLVKMPVGERLFIGHPGVLEGFSSCLSIDPLSGNGVLIMSNMGSMGVDQNGDPVPKGKVGGQPPVGFLTERILEMLV